MRCPECGRVLAVVGDKMVCKGCGDESPVMVVPGLTAKSLAPKVVASETVIVKEEVKEDQNG